MEVPVHGFHSAQSGSGSQVTDTVGHHFDKKGTDHFTNQFKKHLGQHHGIVALSGEIVKKGNRQKGNREIAVCKPAKSSRLFISPF